MQEVDDIHRAYDGAELLRLESLHNGVDFQPFRFFESRVRSMLELLESLFCSGIFYLLKAGAGMTQWKE